MLLSKIIGVLSLVILPLSASLWYKSHSQPEHYRYDVTPYKSLRVYLQDGRCSFRLLNLPMKTAMKSDFRGPLVYTPPTQSTLALSTELQGAYRITWLIFPLWLSTSALLISGVFPFAYGPVRRKWRQWHNGCMTCGFDLRGTRSRRCSECGTRF